MAKIPRQQLFAPVGGMNQDDSIITPTPKYAGRNAFAEGDYKYLLNARVGSSNSDNFGDVETIKGTTEVTSYYVRSGAAWISGSRPAGTEKVIGRYENKEQQRLYYAVYNSAGNHCLRYYDVVTNAVYELMKWSGLSFESTYFVKMAMIDNWLAITDRENSPRIMNVDTISDLYNTLTSNFREYHISFHKWAPVMPPRIKAYYDGVTNNYENFENKALQWSYRYIYNGRLKSRWSPISVAVQSFPGNSGNEVTHILIEIPGFNLDVPGAATQYNYFGNDNVKFYEAVEYIEIAYREGARDVWRLFKRYEVASSGNTSFTFDGETSNSTPIPEDDFYQLFDTVPFQAGTVEAVDNRFVFADILEEYDAAPEPEVTDVGTVSYNSSQTNDYLWNQGYSDAGDNASLFSAMSAGDADIYGNLNRMSELTFKGRGKYKLGIQWIAASGWRSAVYTNDDWIYEIPEDTGTIDQIYALTFKFPTSFVPPEWAVAYQIMRTNCLNIDYFMFGAANAFTALIDDTAAYADNLEMPEFMRDRMRQHFEGARTVTAQDYDKYLETLYNKSIFKSIASDVRRTVAAGSVAVASRLYININNWYNSSKKNSAGTENNPMNNLFYNYREGDRVRFIASTTASPSDAQKAVYDAEILEFTGKGIIVRKPDSVAWVPFDDATADAKDFVIEVYTPKVPKEADYLYHETGEWYPVLYPGHANRDMAKRDWLFTLNSAVTCSTYGDIKVFPTRPFCNGDCHSLGVSSYFDIRFTVTTSVNIRSASMNQDSEKTYDFWEKCIGRSAPAYTDLPVANFKPTQTRFGGQIVEESFVNQLNRFKDQDQKIFPSEYGRIRYLLATANAQVESVGTILLAIGEREAFSIYVNRTTLEDLSGRTQVTLSDRILGSYNTLLGSHGTLNPESVTLHRGRVYYWDAINGTWVRYGRDGLTAISQEYKMSTWFDGLSDLMISKYGSAENPVAICEFNPAHDELIVYNNHSSLPATFRDYTSYKGAVFSETDKRWKYIHDFSPEMFGKLNKQLFSFKAGGLYTHDSSDTNSTFYGTKYDVKIEPVFNDLPKDMKSWQGITIISSHGWSVERLLSEYRGAKTKQQSSINLADFEEREDGYYAAVKMDENTPLVSYPLITGGKMRSKAVRALLKLDPSITTMSLLHYVLMGEIDSPKNS